MKNYTEFSNKVIEYFADNYPGIVMEMKNCDHNEGQNINSYHQEGSVWKHTLLVVKEAIKYSDARVIVAALLHDIGKTRVRDVVKKENGDIRVRFFNHSAVSLHMAVDIVNKIVAEFKDYLSDYDTVFILNLIAAHDLFFNNLSSDVINKMLGKYAPLFIRELLELATSDNAGRITEKKNYDDFNSYIFNITMGLNNYINDELFDEAVKDVKYKMLKGCNSVEFLIGVPYAGKSNYIKKVKNEKTVVISRDEIVEELGKELGETNYNSAYAIVDHKKVNEIMMKRYNDDIKFKGDYNKVIIDLTNINKKVRRKFMAPIEKNKAIIKKATVFYIGKKELEKRIYNRTDKIIPKEAMTDYIKRYTLPYYDEFDSIDFRVE